MAVFDTTFFSPAMGRSVPLKAIVPIERRTRGGGGYSSEKLRSLYLLHGYSSDHTEWLYNSRIQLYAVQHNIAVFMPSGENGFYLNDTARAANYEHLLAGDLIEFTRAAFPLSDRREDTSIGGLSMGGYGALHTGLRNNDVFGNIIALSSALIAEQVSKMKESDDYPMAPYSYYVHTFGSPSEIIGSDRDLKALASGVAKAGKNLPNIYIACGTEDFGIESNREHGKYFAELGLPVKYEEGPGVHDWAFWDEYIVKALDWMKEIVPN